LRACSLIESPLEVRERELIGINGKTTMAIDTLKYANFI
jgi:hypothetical protein